jgi:DNA-directed RNA polymerase specialized sigma24 family protein
MRKRRYNLFLSQAFHKLEVGAGNPPSSTGSCRIALRVCLDKLRSRKRCPELLFSELSAEEEDWLKNAQSCPDEVGTESAAGA